MSAVALKWYGMLRVRDVRADDMSEVDEER